MAKGGIIMDVTNAREARIAEEAGVCEWSLVYFTSNVYYQWYTISTIPIQDTTQWQTIMLFNLKYVIIRTRVHLEVMWHFYDILILFEWQGVGLKKKNM